MWLIPKSAVRYRAVGNNTIAQTKTSETVDRRKGQSETENEQTRRAYVLYKKNPKGREFMHLGRKYVRSTNREQQEVEEERHERNHGGIIVVSNKYQGPGYCSIHHCTTEQRRVLYFNRAPERRRQETSSPSSIFYWYVAKGKRELSNDIRTYVGKIQSAHTESRGVTFG